MSLSRRACYTARGIANAACSISNSVFLAVCRLSWTNSSASPTSGRAVAARRWSPSRRSSAAGTRRYGDAGLPVQLVVERDGAGRCSTGARGRCAQRLEATRLLTPWATPVSITTSGRLWRHVHQMALHSSTSASLYQPYVWRPVPSPFSQAVRRFPPAGLRWICLLPGTARARRARRAGARTSPRQSLSRSTGSYRAVVPTRRAAPWPRGPDGHELLQNGMISRTTVLGSDLLDALPPSCPAAAAT